MPTFSHLIISKQAVWREFSSFFGGVRFRLISARRRRPPSLPGGTETLNASTVRTSPNDLLTLSNKTAFIWPHLPCASSPTAYVWKATSSTVPRCWAFRLELSNRDSITPNVLFGPSLNRRADVRLLELGKSLWLFGVAIQSSKSSTAVV